MSSSFKQMPSSAFPGCSCMSMSITGTWSNGFMEMLALLAPLTGIVECILYSELPKGRFSLTNSKFADLIWLVFGTYSSSFSG